MLIPRVVKIKVLFKNKFWLLSTFLFLLIFVSFSNSIHAVNSQECKIKWVKDSAGVLTYYLPIEIIIDKHPACSSIQTSTFGFRIPSLGDILTFAIRVFFVIAGIAALFYMLIGAFTWVTSGGEEEAVTKAREKIQAAVIGMILIVGVLAIIWTLEQVIFNRRICLGLSCTLTLPGLVKVTNDIEIREIGGVNTPIMETSKANCCRCLKPDGSRGEAINTFLFKCLPNGDGTPL